MKTRMRFREILDTRVLEVDVPKEAVIKNQRDGSHLPWFFIGANITRLKVYCEKVSWS